MPIFLIKTPLAITKRLDEREVRYTLPTINFNNALIEVYDERYHKMGYHSDLGHQQVESGCYLTEISKSEVVTDLETIPLIKIQKMGEVVC